MRVEKFSIAPCGHILCISALRLNPQRQQAISEALLLVNTFGLLASASKWR